MIGIPERPLAHVPVDAVSQQSPVAGFLPLIVVERFTEAAYRVHDNHICFRLQHHSVGLPVEVTLQIRSTQQLQTFGAMFMFKRFIC